MDGACFAVGSVAREGSFWDVEETKAKVRISKDLIEVTGLQKLSVGFFFPGDCG